MSDTSAPIERRWRGRYHDGLSALGHPVEIRLGLETLEIVGRDATPLAAWRYAALTAIEPVRAGEPAVLAAGSEDDARLTLTEPRRYDALVARAPQLRRRPLAHALRAVARTAAWLGAITALGAALWFGWPWLADGLATLIPAHIETRIGGQARAQLTGHTRICDAPAAQGVLVHLLALITTAAHDDRPVAITVIDLPVVNAFALPGDQIVVFRRMIAEAQSPEELAAVLAHEVGHLTLNHPMRNLVRQFGLAMIITALSGSSSWDGAAQMLLAAHYSREFEEAADARALDTLAEAGIGGQGWIDFFDRHAKANGRLERAAAYLSTHPPSAARRDQAARLPPTGRPLMSAGDWLVLKTICGK